jgi:hypothetical protein
MCYIYVECVLFKKYFGRRHRTADIGFAYGGNALSSPDFNICRMCSLSICSQSATNVGFACGGDCAWQRATPATLRMSIFSPAAGCTEQMLFSFGSYAIVSCSWQCARRVTLRMSSLSPRDDSDDDDEEAEILKVSAIA